jgi:excisionase family DNA binding protein
VLSRAWLLGATGPTQLLPFTSRVIPMGKSKRTSQIPASLDTTLTVRDVATRHCGPLPMSAMLGSNGEVAQIVRQATSPNPSSTPEPHYTVREVADIYRVTPRCVRHWIENEELRAWRKGRLIRIPQSALVEFDRAR